MGTSADPRNVRIAGRILGGAIVLGGIASVIVVTRVGYLQPRTDDATVRANVVGIAPQVSGPISQLNVHDNEQVQTGDILFTIDSRPFELAVQQARARLELAESQVAALTRGVTVAGDELKQLQPQAAYAQRQYQRMQELAQEQAVAADELDQARAKANSAAARLLAGQQEIAKQRALVAQVGQFNAHVTAAQVALASAELDLAHSVVRAPFPARVTNLNITRGAYATAGQEVFGLVDTRDWYVIANFQETYLASIQSGMPVEVFLLPYPGRRFRGTVEGVSWAVQPGDDRQTGLLPQVNSTLNWVRLAQRMPVRIRLEATDPEHPFRMGMSAVVTVNGGAPFGRAGQ
jgi:multidrug resistance efflux pump